MEGGNQEAGLHSAPHSVDQVEGLASVDHRIHDQLAVEGGQLSAMSRGESQQVGAGHLARVEQTGAVGRDCGVYSEWRRVGSTGRFTFWPETG